jgi:hypothetical protein
MDAVFVRGKEPFSVDIGEKFRGTGMRQGRHRTLAAGTAAFQDGSALGKLFLFRRLLNMLIVFSECLQPLLFTTLLLFLPNGLFGGNKLGGQLLFLFRTAAGLFRPTLQ